MAQSRSEQLDPLLLLSLACLCLPLQACSKLVVYTLRLVLLEGMGYQRPPFRSNRTDRHWNENKGSRLL